MTGKRKFECSVHEVGQSSRGRPSRKLSTLENVISKPTYFDDGDCEFVCEFCNAFFWFAERITRPSSRSRPQYTHCCKGGVVRLPFPLYPPAELKLLFDDTQFMDNVRAYNNMFSMTSFGARIDEAVNDGRGPYVFKVCGQVSHWIGSLCPATNDSPRFLQLYIYDTNNEVPNRLRFFDTTDDRCLSAAVVATLSRTAKRDGVYWVEGTITSVDRNKEFCYLACRICGKKVQMLADRKWCSYCQAFTFTNIYRYNVEIVVADESDTARMTLWNRATQKLLGEPAEDVVSLYGDTARVMPDEIAEKIIEKEGLFEVVICSNRSHNDAFNVSRLTVDDEIKDAYIMRNFPAAYEESSEDESFLVTMDYVEEEDRESEN
ncbi:hypothetical protein CASFOL_012582 [Castilleja foliolosa]|uniref:Replication factor A C-terminal domain-containing protein n=1 Tax=Castilleja foliolosa TaxID=1961234 RepID=A0ABD3DJA9_9LAMI